MFHKVEPCQQNNYILSYWLSHSESFTSFFGLFHLSVRCQAATVEFHVLPDEDHRFKCCEITSCITVVDQRKDLIEIPSE